MPEIESSDDSFSSIETEPTLQAEIHLTPVKNVPKDLSDLV